MRLHHPSWTTHFKPPGFHISSMFSYFLWSPRKEKWSHSVVSDYWWPHSLPGSSIHGIFQATVLEWAAISFSRVSSWPRDRTLVSCISCIVRRILYHWTTREAQFALITFEMLNTHMLLAAPIWDNGGLVNIHICQQNKNNPFQDLWLKHDQS